MSTTRPDGPRLPSGLVTPLGGSRGSRAPAPPSVLAGLAPVVLLLGAPLGVAALRQGACAADGWEGAEPVWRQCASPLLSSLAEDGAGRGVLAYLTGGTTLDVPVLRGLTTTLLATLAPGDALAQQRWVLVLWAAVAAVLLAGLVVAVGTVRRHPGADPVALALSPVLALTVLFSVDLVPLALAVVAVWAWSRGRPTLAGALAGVALLGGLPAVVVLLALVLTPPPVRDARRRLLTAAGVAVLLVVGPVAALDLGLLLEPVRAWLGAGAGPGSPWFVPTLALHPLGDGHVAVLALLGLLLAGGLATVLAARRPPPSTAEVALLALVLLLLTGTGLPPAAAIWLVPFLALAGVPWRDHLVWAGAEAAHAVALFGYLTAQGDPSHGLPAGWYATALALRVLALGRLGWVVWARAMWGGGPEGPAGSWAHPRGTGTLERLPSAPVDKSAVDVGDDAYPPVTERP